MITTRRDWPGVDKLAEAVIGTGKYQPVANVVEDPDKAYGLFGGTVYLRSPNGIVQNIDLNSASMGR
jgi:hypothetical protein